MQKIDELRQENMRLMDDMLQTDSTALNYALRSEATKLLKQMIVEVAQIADLDEEKIARRITVAAKSPYGRIPGLINLLVSIVLWPVEGNDFSGVAETKEEILNKLGLDEELLVDIKEAKGFHTFFNDDHEIIKGQAPDFDEYRMLVTMLARKLDIAVVDFKLKEDHWKAAEEEAIESAELEVQEAQLELERFKQMTSAS